MDDQKVDRLVAAIDRLSLLLGTIAVAMADGFENVTREDVAEIQAVLSTLEKKP